MRFLKRLWVETTSFFEGDETGEEEINLKVLSITFFLGLLLLFGTYFLFYDESRTAYGIPSSIYGWVKQSCSNIYTYTAKSYRGVVYSIQTSATGETRLINNNYKTSGCKNCRIDTELKTEQDKEVLAVDYRLSHKGYFWRQMHKIIERAFGAPIDFGWVQIKKDFDGLDLSQYDSISLWVKGSGEPSGLEFSIIESDGDAWYYFDKNSLTSKDWVEIRMPFKDFVNPKWASQGDEKKDFKNITRIGLTITNFEKPVKNMLYLETSDGEIFKLI